jgi:hypothetical protein
MTWNYRVFREEDGDYIIREVFYDADGAILGCTENAVEPAGRSLEELTQDVEWFKEALAMPVLTLADIPGPTGMGTARTKDRSQNLSREQLMTELGLEEPSTV